MDNNKQNCRTIIIAIEVWTFRRDYLFITQSYCIYIYVQTMKEKQNQQNLKGKGFEFGNQFFLGWSFLSLSQWTFEDIVFFLLLWCCMNSWWLFAMWNKSSSILLWLETSFRIICEILSGFVFCVKSLRYHQWSSDSMFFVVVFFSLKTLNFVIDLVSECHMCMSIEIWEKKTMFL